MVSSLQRTPIPRSRPPAVDEFVEHYLLRRTPVVLEGLAADWPACRLWNPDYFAARYPALGVPVEVWNGPSFADVRRVTMSFTSYVAALREPAIARVRLYLAGYRILARLPELEAHLGAIPYLDQRAALPPYFFMGAPGTRTPLHYDISHNFLAQVSGKKRAVLVSPAHARALYHPTLLDRHYWGSPVDVEAPDLARFPRSAGVEFRETVLEAGDVLFIPGRWRHALLSLEETISLGFFWQDSLDQRIAKQMLSWIRRPSI